jgi:hypothetical protein
VRLLEFCAMAQNWETAVELDAFAQGATADFGFIREAAEAALATSIELYIWRAGTDQAAHTSGPPRSRM